MKIFIGYQVFVKAIIYILRLRFSVFGGLETLPPNNRYARVNKLF